MDNQNKELYFAKTVIGAIENVKVPMLMYEEEKEVVKKALQMYINKIEMDARLKLPYAINDTVYYLDDITPFEEMPIEGRISGFRVTWCRTIVIHITTNFNDEGCLADRNEDIDVVAEEFGKTVFFTKEEAEAALEELERGKHERTGKDFDSD